MIKHPVRIIPISKMIPPELKSKFNPMRSLFDLCSHWEKPNELFEKLGQSFSQLKYLKYAQMLPPTTIKLTKDFVTAAVPIITTIFQAFPKLFNPIF